MNDASIAVIGVFFTSMLEAQITYSPREFVAATRPFISVVSSTNKMFIDEDTIANLYFECLALVLHRRNSIEQLTIGDSRLKFNHILRMQDVLRDNHTIKLLDMNSNALRDDSAELIGTILKSNTTINQLNLDYNKIKGKGARCISDALKVNSTLKDLRLSNNRLSEYGGWVIGEALKVNTCLRRIDLGNTYLCDAGIENICKALETNTTLEAITLSENDLHNHAAIMMSDMLKINTTLEFLNISENDIDILGMQTIVEALKANTALETVYIGENCINTMRDYLNLNAALEHNRTIMFIDDDMCQKWAMRNRNVKYAIHEEQISLLVGLAKSAVLIPWHIPGQFAKFVTSKTYNHWAYEKKKEEKAPRPQRKKRSYAEALK